MSMPDKELTRKLAEIKSFLERRIKQESEELNLLRSFNEIVDMLLAEKSFRPVEIGASGEPTTQPAITTQVAGRGTPVLTSDGLRIAAITVEGSNLHVVPEAEVALDANSPPLRAFLVSKVLEPMQKSDKDAASKGSIPPEQILTYSIEQEDDRLKAVHIQNYGGSQRLIELRNAIRWTLRRMYERSGTRT